MQAWKKNGYFLITMMLAVVMLAGCASNKNLTGKTSSIVSSADGSAIHYGVQGQGDTTLIFVHCWTCNHTFWDQQVAEFSQHYQVVWLDLAGHGESGSQRKQYSIKAFGSDVAAVANAVGVKRIILVGHSMGGPVAIEAAKQLGDRVVGVVGVDTFYTAFKFPQSEEKIRAFVKPFEQDFKKTTEQMVRSMFLPSTDPQKVNDMVQALINGDEKMAVSAMYELFEWNAHQGKAMLRQLNGKLRNINANPDGKQTAQHKGVVMIPGVGHFVPQIKPNEFNLALQNIINDWN